jgi:hypothetical protein
MLDFNKISTLILVALSLALPMTGQAQGTAPAQGVTQPGTPPQPEAPPPAPKPGTITDGRPRIDQGGGAAQTTPSTTSSLPLPPTGQADPSPRR